MRAIDFVSDYGVSLASLHKLGDEITKSLKFETLYDSQDNAFPVHWRSPVSLEPRMLAEFQQTKLAVYNGADLIVKEPTQRGQEMTIFAFATVLSLGMVTMAASATAQQGHGHPHGMDMSTKHGETMPPNAALKPAHGASIKIISPKPGQEFKGDRVPIRFSLVKGKTGHHVHAYVDGELMGMFESSTGTLTGVKPGMHVLQIRVVEADHKTELDASDEVKFVVK